MIQLLHRVNSRPILSQFNKKFVINENINITQNEGSQIKPQITTIQGAVEFGDQVGSETQQKSRTRSEALERVGTSSELENDLK